MDFDSQDSKTLSLAIPELNEDILARFIVYQQTLAEQMNQSGEKHVVMAAAHEAAVQKSGLSWSVISRLEPIVRDFCGRRHVERTLEWKLKALQARGEATADMAKEVAQRAARPLLEQRYGARVVELLMTQEDLLLPIHQRLLAG